MEESYWRKRIPRLLCTSKVEALNRSYDNIACTSKISVAELVSSLWCNFIKYPSHALYNPKIVIISVNFRDRSKWPRCENINWIIVMVWYNWLENYCLYSQRKSHGQMAFSIGTMVDWGRWRRCNSRDNRLVLGMEGILQADCWQRWDSRGL